MTKKGHQTSLYPSLNGFRDQKAAPAGMSAPPRPGARVVRVGGKRFRARFLRFVAGAHPFSAPFGPSPPASDNDLPAHRCPDLRFYNAPSPTGALRAPPRGLAMQRTSKNVHEPGPRRRACNEPQKTCSQDVQPDAGAAARAPRAGDGRGRCRRVRGKPFRARFFRFVARLRTGSDPFEGVRGVSRALVSISYFFVIRLTCGFARRGWRRGRIGRARLRNKPKKMCTKRHVRVQLRNKPQKTCRQRPAPPPGSARGLRPEGAGRRRRPARLRLVHPRAPAGRARPPTRGQPHETCTNRRRVGAAAVRTSAAGAVRPQPACPAICGGFVRRIRWLANHGQQGR